MRGVRPIEHMDDPLLRTVVEEILPPVLRARLSREGGGSVDCMYTAALADVYRLLFAILASSRLPRTAVVDLLPGGIDRWDPGSISGPVGRVAGSRTGRVSSRATCKDENADSGGEPEVGRGGPEADTAIQTLLQAVALHLSAPSEFAGAPPWGRLHERLREWEVRMVEPQHGGPDTAARSRTRARVPVIPGIEIVRQSRRRHRDGCYSTPAPVVRWIVEQTVGPAFDERRDAFLRLIQRRDRAGARRPRVHGRAKSQVPEREARRLEDAGIRVLFSLSICDPAMGDGRFLVEASRYLADRIVGLIVQCEDQRMEEAVRQLWSRHTGDAAPWSQGWREERRCAVPDLRQMVRHLVIERCLFGIDIDPAAVTLAERALWLETMSGGPPLPIVGPHLCCGDALLGARLSRGELARGQGKARDALRRSALDGAVARCIGQDVRDRSIDTSFFHWELEFPEVFGPAAPEGGFPWTGAVGFDCVVGNPPFESCDTLARARPELARAYKRLYPEVVSPGSKPDIYFFFLARAMEAVRPGGLIGLVMPNRVLAADAAGRLRRAILSNRIVAVRGLDARHTFPDADVPPIALVLRRGPPGDNAEYVTITDCGGAAVCMSEGRPRAASSEDATRIPQRIAAELGLVVTGLDEVGLQLVTRVREGRSGFGRAGEIMRVREGLRGEILNHEAYVELPASRRNDYLPLFRGSQIDRYIYHGPSGYYRWPRESRVHADQPGRATNRTRQLEPKVAIAELGERIECCRADDVAYGGVYFVAVSDLAGPMGLDLVCALLNSALMSALYRMLYGATAWHGSLKFRSRSLERLPVPRLASDTSVPSPREVAALRDLARHSAEHNDSSSLLKLRGEVARRPGSLIVLLDDLGRQMRELGERVRTEAQETGRRAGRRRRDARGSRDTNRIPTDGGLRQVAAQMKNLDKTIDQLIYAWYGLSPREVHLVAHTIRGRTIRGRW